MTNSARAVSSPREATWGGGRPAFLLPAPPRTPQPGIGGMTGQPIEQTMTILDLIAIATGAAFCGWAFWRGYTWRPAPPEPAPETQDDPFTTSIARWGDVMDRRNRN